MKIILDDTNPGDARLMQVLGAVMTQQAQQAQAKNQTPVEPAAPQKPVVAAVPDEDPEVTEEEVIGKHESLPEEDLPEVDADGVEWDEELHASTKTKTADGRWKKRRGTAKAAPVEQKTEAKAPTESATIEQFREAVVTHKGKFGIDRTKEMLVNVAGVNTPSEVPQEQWAEMINALNSDTGAASNDINLDDFC